MKRRWQQKDPYNLSYAERLEKQLKTESSNLQSDALKSQVRESLKGYKHLTFFYVYWSNGSYILPGERQETITHRRARSLLQSAGKMR